MKFKVLSRSITKTQGHLRLVLETVIDGVTKQCSTTINQTQLATLTAIGEKVPTVGAFVEGEFSVDQAGQVNEAYCELSL